MNSHKDWCSDSECWKCHPKLKDQHYTMLQGVLKTFSDHDLKYELDRRDQERKQDKISANKNHIENLKEQINKIEKEIFEEESKYDYY